MPVSSGFGRWRPIGTRLWLRLVRGGATCQAQGCASDEQKAFPPSFALDARRIRASGWTWRRRSDSSRPSSPRSQRVWGWDCRSAVRSLMPTVASCGHRRIFQTAPSSSSRCQPRSATQARRDGSAYEFSRRQGGLPAHARWLIRWRPTLRDFGERQPHVESEAYVSPV